MMVKNCAPSRVADALGEVVVLEHVGRLQVLVIDRVVLLDIAPTPSCDESPAADGAPSDAPWRAAPPPCLPAVTPPLAACSTRRCAVFSARSALRYQPGEKMRVPSDRVANASIPRVYAGLLTGGRQGALGTSAQEIQAYHAVGFSTERHSLRVCPQLVVTSAPRCGQSWKAPGNRCPKRPHCRIACR